MGRRRQNVALNVFMNQRFVGVLIRDPGGTTEFRYDTDWLTWDNALPVSLSLPLQDQPHKGAPVTAVFENLLPDRDAIRKRVAERVRADGTDAFSLLARIGRDCVGALQFLPQGEDISPHTAPEGVPVSDTEIETLLVDLARDPLGLTEDEHFRISLAGAQEKTALLWHNNQWMKPLGTTPTTHILKPQIGQIAQQSGTIDLTDSVENEYYCLNLLRAFGLSTTEAEIAQFGARKVLVVTRFDRLWTRDGRLIRLPQEDFCQALSIPPTRKYQNDGGPGMTAILDLLRGSDTPQADQMAVLKSQIIFWLIGATDGHAKNLSLFLSPGGGFRLTPFYDVLTAQPAFDANQIRHSAFTLAMSVGDRGHYKILNIRGHHFRESAKAAGLGSTLIDRVFSEVVDDTSGILDTLAAGLPADFPLEIHNSVRTAALHRLTHLA